MMKLSLAGAFLLLGSFSLEACGQVPPTIFTLSTHTEIVGNEDLMPAAEYLSLYTNAKSTLKGREAYDKILLKTDLSIPEEGFRVEVGKEGVTLTGGGYGGVFNACQAFIDLLPKQAYAKRCPENLTLRDTLIEDSPRFSYRGVMLDVARTWMDKSRVMRLMDLMAHYRLNKLHLHLTDDEGWRIEIPSHPELCTVGAYRGKGSPIRAVYGKWGERYGGYYTVEDLKEMVAYAAQRNIEIIPEIDLPGHSRNIASVHPEIRCAYQPNLRASNGYDYRSAWCVAREENYQLLDDIFKTVCEVFPSRRIHIGGDEVDVSQWKRCPNCRALMLEKGLKEEQELEDVFLERISQILAKYGKVPAVWNEAVMSGKFNPESLVYGWQDTKKCLDAIRKGYQTVVMPGEYFYLDMRQSKHEDGHDWAGVFDARKMAKFDFKKAGFTTEAMKKVVGLEAPFWSEAYLSHNPETTDYLDYMLFPRLCTLSEIAWRGQVANWATFYRRLREKDYERLSALDVRFRLFPPKVHYRAGKNGEMGVLTASTNDGAKLFYRQVDGRRGQIFSPNKILPYTKPIKTNHPECYEFLSRRGSGRSPWTAHPSFYETIHPEVNITTSLPQSEKFPLERVETYGGFARTLRGCQQWDWILYTFPEPVTYRQIEVQTGNPQLPKGIFTTGYVEVSADGHDFQRVGSLEKGAYTLRARDIPASLYPIKAVRVVSTAVENGTPYVTINPLRIKPEIQAYATSKK